MPKLEYFYVAHSAYAYLGSRRFLDIAGAANVAIIHKPYDLRRAMVAIGSTLIGQRSDAHRAYFFNREIKRWSEQRGAPVMAGRPTHHDNDVSLPNRLLIACQAKGLNVDGLAHAILEAHWRDDADHADRDTLAQLASALGLDATMLLEEANSDDIRAQYEANTSEAIERSVFGSPTYFVDGDMFYGQDRLELVERALSQPYAGSWPLRSCQT